MPETRRYGERLREHLARYKREVLGVAEDGIWTKNGKPYLHILPRDRAELNLLPDVRAAVLAHIRESGTKLHHGFHHLNSSQAMALNLFWPFLADAGAELPVLLDALGVGGRPVSGWDFEKVLDSGENTNFDFYLELDSGARLFFELKLSETEFGSATANARHERKRTEIYLPRLTGKVAPEVLEPPDFFANYQILRNISYVDPERGDHGYFVFPRANQSLGRGQAFIETAPTTRLLPHIHVLHLEDLVATLRERSRSEDASFANHLVAFGEKYLCR